MSYVKSTLLPNEKLVLLAEIHWIVFIPPLFWFALAIFVYFRMDVGMMTGEFQQLQGPAYLMLEFSSLELIFALLFVFIGVISTINALVHYLTTEFAVTDKRVIVKVGFIQRDTWELNVNRVTSLNVDQSMLGRLLDYGDVRVVGMGGSSAPIRAVVNPLQFRRVVLSEVEVAKF